MRTGTVDRVSSKPVTTKFGPKKTYSLQIDGTWYSCGFTDPRCGVGEEVAFESSSGPYGEEIIKGTLVRTGAATSHAARATVAVPTPVAESAPKSTGGGFQQRPFPVPALHGDRAIIRQNALSHAARILCGVMEVDAAAADDDAFANRVIAMARKFEAYSCGDLDREMAEGMINKAKKSAAKAAVETELGE